MKKKQNVSKTYPVEDALSLIGKKWTIYIIRDLLDGERRFGEIQRSLVGISPRTLSARLSQLEASGIINKVIYPVSPPHTEYSLTKHGLSLKNILLEIILWDKKYRKQDKEGSVI